MDTRSERYKKMLEWDSGYDKMVNICIRKEGKWAAFAAFRCFASIAINPDVLAYQGTARRWKECLGLRESIGTDIVVPFPVQGLPWRSPKDYGVLFIDYDSKRVMGIQSETSIDSERIGVLKEGPGSGGSTARNAINLEKALRAGSMMWAAVGKDPVDFPPEIATSATPMLDAYRFICKQTKRSAPDWNDGELKLKVPGWTFGPDASRSTVHDFLRAVTELGPALSPEEVAGWNEWEPEGDGLAFLRQLSLEQALPSLTKKPKSVRF